MLFNIFSFFFTFPLFGYGLNEIITIPRDDSVGPVGKNIRTREVMPEVEN